jgi:hypothetical protein
MTSALFLAWLKPSSNTALGDIAVGHNSLTVKTKHTLTKQYIITNENNNIHNETLATHPPKANIPSQKLAEAFSCTVKGAFINASSAASAFETELGLPEVENIHRLSNSISQFSTYHK